MLAFQAHVTESPEKHPNIVVSETVTVETPKYVSSPVEQFVEVKTLIKEEQELLYSEEEINLVALVTMAEAEAESEQGQRLVIDTILNRVDSDKFPNTVKEVIYQKNQFSSMWNGRVDRCHVRDDIYQLVKEEMEERSNDEVMFFGANDYSDYGVPMFKEGGHYFSSYN